MSVPGGGRRNSWVDNAIREAQERGEFDNLPGKGKPLQGIDGPPDELWWIKQYLAREQLSYLPPALALRLERDQLLDGLEKVPTERAVRTAVEELNERIRELNRKPVVEGPPSTLMPLDVDTVVERWRSQRPAPAPAPTLSAASPDDEHPPVVWWRWRERRRRNSL